VAVKTTRTHIIEAADKLFYARGFDHTSFADIASVVDISRGNFYYHFKTKDEILEEVIHLRLANTRAMLARWEDEAVTPVDAIESFIRIQIVNGAKIKEHGCSVGTLCGELAKLDHGLHDEATALFSLFRDWLGEQFEKLGAGPDADQLAMHLLVRSQGVATMANAFRDDEFVVREVALMGDWLKLQIENFSSQEKN